MLPLIDKDGLVKPAILILLEQLAEAGIEEICLVVGGEDDIRAYNDFFMEQLPEEHLSKLSKEMRKYENLIRTIGERISYKIQSTRLGFGHAVSLCADFAGEPVLLLLGDTVYTSTRKENCTQQLIEIYEAIEKPLVAIHKIPIDQTCHYGILSCTWLDDSRSKMEITKFIEKPVKHYAEQNLFMHGKDDEREYYAVFGQYILPPEIFEVLSGIVSNEQEQSSEVNMTDALSTFIGKGLTGVVLDGAMYDIGNPDAYKETFASYAKSCNCKL
jgi:UTP-glucose-1-phosphate uridylyltransferase